MALTANNTIKCNAARNKGVERVTTMQNKIKKIIQLMNGECDDITMHNVSARWYRMNVDMEYKGDRPVDIVQCTYDPELYAIPQYMTAAEFASKSAEEIAEAWEI